MELHRAPILLFALFAGALHANPAEQAAAIAERYVGTPYRWGGTTPEGFDCSGLVQFAYAEAGVANLPRTVVELRANTRPVEPDDLRKGDLLFFRLRNGRRSHVGIYLGEGRFVHATTPGKDVANADLAAPYWQQRFVGAGRIVLSN